MTTNIREGDVFMWPDWRRLKIDWIKPSPTAGPGEWVGYQSWGRLIWMYPSWRRTPRDVFEVGLADLAPWCCVSQVFAAEKEDEQMRPIFQDAISEQK